VHQWQHLLVFIYNEVEGSREGRVFTDQDMLPCPAYTESGYRALKRDLRGPGFVVMVAHKRYVLHITGAQEARRLLGI
jgi:hypothetical protein